jgi:hypothetical protein
MFFRNIDSFLQKHKTTDLPDRYLEISANSLRYGKIWHRLKIINLIIDGDEIVVEMPQGLVLLFFHPNSKRTFIVGPKKRSFKYKLTQKFVPVYKQLLGAVENMEEPTYFNKEVKIS